MARPTVSLGYAGKNDRLLEEFGLGAFVQPMDAFDVDLLLAQMAEIQAQPGLEVVMKDVVRRYEDDLAGQFRHLSNSGPRARSDEPHVAASTATPSKAPPMTSVSQWVPCTAAPAP